MWKLLQLAVFSAVIFSNIHYNWAWGTSPLAVAVVALAAAWLSTALIIAILDLLRRGKALLFGSHQSIDDRRLPRV